MGKLIRWRLRWEFFAITILAGSLPLAFYAWYSLNFFKNSLQEIQNDVLLTEIGDAEALYRTALKRLKEDTQRLSRRIERNRAGGGVAGALDSLVPRGVDFVYLIENGRSEFLPDQETQKPPRQSLRDPLDSFAQGIGGRKAVSGLIELGGEPFLVSTQPLGSNEALGGERLILGIDIKNSLVPRLSEMISSRIALGIVDSEEQTEETSDIRILDVDPSVFTARKTIRGVDAATTFYLQLDLNTGLFSRVESQQFWFFVFFTVALYLSSFLATTWAATWILKPINRLVRTMVQVKGPETYTKRLSVDRTDEIGMLTSGFNRLMERLDAAQREVEIAEAQRIEAERLETIHAMVLTLAHEINNPLTYILGEADLMLMEEDLSAEERRRAEVIRAMSLRISGVIKDLQELQRGELVTYLDWQKMVKIKDDAVEGLVWSETPSVAEAALPVV